MLLDPGIDEVRRELPVAEVLDEAALHHEARPLEVARREEDARRDLRLEADAAGGLGHRGGDLEVLAADPQRVAHGYVELEKQRRVDEDQSGTGSEFVPAIGGPREDGAVDRIHAVDRDEVDQSTAIGLRRQGHGAETRHSRRGLECRGLDRLEGLEDLGAEGVAALEPQIRAEELLGAEIDRVVHRLAQRMEADDDGDADRHAAAVEAEATRGRAQLTADHREDEPRMHRATSPPASPRARSGRKAGSPHPLRFRDPDSRSVRPRRG